MMSIQEYKNRLEKQAEMLQAQDTEIADLKRRLQEQSDSLDQYAKTLEQKIKEFDIYIDHLLKLLHDLSDG